MQDKHCIESYTRAKKAWDSKVFEHEIAPCTISSRKGDVIINQDDEYLNIDFSKVSTLKPVFVKTGTITAANASSLSDGAAALVLTSVKTASEQNLKPIAEILGFADAACAPKDFSIAPSLAIPKALSNAGISIKDVDLWELNEAFSAVALVNEKILGLDPAKVNIYGGAVALGHPIGSSGARILVTLVHALKQGQIGVAAICNGGGASTAIVVKKV